MTATMPLLLAATDRARRGQFDRWTDQAAGTGYCANPIRLIGHTTRVDTSTGEVLSSYHSSTEPDGVTYKRCGNRRAAECPTCSDEYKGDQWHMIVAGAVGGYKGVPTSVADHPLVFATFTAPSFGLVHASKKPGRPGTRRCRPRSKKLVCPHGRPTWCMATHDENDPHVGQPLCDRCYDYQGQVLWQWWAPVLWRVFITTLERRLADRLGLDRRTITEVVKVQFAKVAEFQLRGVVHFHALMRLDGAATPTDPYPAPPPGIDAQDLCEVIRQAAADASYTTPDDPVAGPVRVQFGAQLDARPVHRSANRDDTDGPVLHPEVIAAYVAKYATKATADLEPGHRPRNPHLRRVRQTVDQLSDRVDRTRRDSPYRLLAHWRSTLGFRGHFSTKSRHYSTTLGAIRQERQDWQIAAAKATHTRAVATGTHPRTDPPPVITIGDQALEDLDQDSTLIIKSWQYGGRGWATPGDAALAALSAEQALARRHHREPAN